MSNSYEKIKSMCNNLNISEGKLSDEYLFTINAVDLFFYKRNIVEIDIKSGFVDGPNDGGIDFIYSNTDKMYLFKVNHLVTYLLKILKMHYIKWSKL